VRAGKGGGQGGIEKNKTSQQWRKIKILHEIPRENGLVFDWKARIDVRCSCRGRLLAVVVLVVVVVVVVVAQS